MDLGAKGDGETDDTDAIQSAINHMSKRGGGKILFPYTKTGYRIGKPGVEQVNGRVCRGQLYIPPGSTNICLEGEMPCCMLYTYQIRTADQTNYGGTTTFDKMSRCNTHLFSTWEAPEEHDPTARPWALLATVEGDYYRGKFSTLQVSVVNLEFRVHLNTEKMYPTTSAVNLQNTSRALVQDSQFCLDKNIGDGNLNKELLSNPCHTVGLMMSGDQNDMQIIRNAGVQGFRYGYVLGEHVYGEYLYVHNCEEGLVYHDSTHLGYINFLVAQHNQVVIATTREMLFGHPKAACNVSFGMVNMESGAKVKPVVSQMKYGIYDPENRLHGTIRWHFPGGCTEFAVVGAENMQISKY